ncbi:cutl-29 [Pristionchus pacificus]|uniref:Cutl-29 n=1 Tax=Pristionchus pacificus TaxID=54126 RepID=A0A2A6BJA6_PRIPA|nr:cutl-29 [Pristionchus pacificus]|eukprot:PDM65967.1 cutl-29 [Pristionchus pacificus]
MVLLLFLTLSISRIQADLISERSVQCKGESMEVSLLFPRPFSGSIFTEKAFEKEACRWKGDGNTRLSISIPTADANLCGISEAKGELSVKLIISPVQGIIVQGFAALIVKCLYTTQDITLSLPGGPLHVSGINVDSSVVTGSGSNPVLSMQILEGHGIEGKTVSRASVGQRITLDAVLKDTSIYDFFLHSCKAHDGSNTPEASIPIIDDNGCGIRLSRAIDIPVMVSKPVPGGAKHIYLHMYGFQFTSSQFVHFECQAKPCIHQCPLQQCSAAPTLLPKKVMKHRLRRQNEITEEDSNLTTLKLLTVIQIEAQQASSAALVASSFENSDPPPVCLSQETLLLSGLALALILVISGFCFVFTVKRIVHKDDDCRSEHAYSVTSSYR